MHIRRRKPGVGYETSCPHTLYHLMDTAGQLARSQWASIQEIVPFTAACLEAWALFYIRTSMPAMAREVTTLRIHLLDVGNFHTVREELRRMMDR
jgi:hypothetical protein